MRRGLKAVRGRTAGRPERLRPPPLDESGSNPPPERPGLLGQLLEAAFEFACAALKPGGAFVGKAFKGGSEHELLARMKRRFATVRHAKPPASRKESAETYVVATGFRG